MQKRFTHFFNGHGERMQQLASDGNIADREGQA
jgi:glycine cleavage system regulatory protein